MRTVLALAYSSTWIGLLVYLWRKAKIPDKLIAPILVLCLAVLYVSPLTTISVPVGRNLPDVDFHAAKILFCSAGYFFNDPVTSYPSIYPPVYHIIIGSIMRLSGAADSWSVLSIFHVLMLIVLFMSVYLLAKTLFNPMVGIFSAMFLGAVFDIPNQSLMLIP
ncbi:MAG TPA: glycosyltransferase family 39 protein, partial [candidate division Zixibacteria bacterium]